VNIEEQMQGAVLILRPHGPLVTEDAEQFRLCAAQAIGEHLGRLVVDTASIPFVDSSGLEALLNVAGEMAQAGQSLKLCALTETLREVLDLTDLADSFDIYADVKTALRSFL
jgi:anti-anti-sigma factor